MKRFILIALLHLFVVTTFAQKAKTNSIKENVLDFKTKEPIGYATISSKNKDHKLIAGTLTSEKGIFALDSIPMRSYQLEIQFMGYKTTVKTIDLTLAAKLDLGSILMEQDATQLKDVVIQGNTSVQLDRQKVGTEINYSIGSPFVVH